MALIGYARVSTADQVIDLQESALFEAGCERIFADHGVSGAKASRPALDRCLEFLRRDDVLVVWKLDRLGRSITHLIELTRDLDDRGVQLKSLTEGFDTTTPAGRLLFHVLAALAEMERALTIERVSAGLAAARAAGRTGGRPRSVTPDKLAVARTMRADGRSIPDIAKTIGVSTSALYRAFDRADYSPFP